MNFSKLDALNNYSSKAQKYIEAKNSLINNVKNLYEGRRKIIKGFKEKIFPIKCDDETDFDELNEQIIKEETKINNDLFKKYFTIYESPSNMYNILNNVKTTKENDIRVNLIKSSLTDLKKDIGNNTKPNA